MQLAQLSNPDFQVALKELSEAPVPILVAYKLTTVIEKVTLELSKFRSLHAKLLVAHGELDEAGNVKVNELGTEYLIKDAEAFNKEFSTLLSIEVELPKISLEDIKEIRLSTKSVALLKPLIEA